jgi:hypothetical protein
MKTELEITEELIEEKTKEYIQANALLLNALEKDQGTVSFGAVEEIFTLQLNAERLEQILQDLHAQRHQLLGNFIEKEQILSSKEEVLRHLAESPDGLYRLTKVERKSSDEGK